MFPNACRPLSVPSGVLSRAAAFAPTAALGWLRRIAKLAAAGTLALSAAVGATAQVTFLGVQYQLPGPWANLNSTAIDSAGNIYIGNGLSIGQAYSNSIIVMNGTTHATSVYLSGTLTCGTTMVALSAPAVEAVDSNNNLIFYNSNTYQLVVWSTTTNSCKAVYGNLSAISAFGLDNTNNLWFASGGACLYEVPANAASGPVSPTVTVNTFCMATTSTPFYIVNSSGGNSIAPVQGIAFAPTTTNGWSAGDMLVSGYSENYDSTNYVNKICVLKKASSFQTSGSCITQAGGGPIAFDSSGNLFCGGNQVNNNSIEKLTPPTYGPGTNLMIGTGGSSFALDASDNIYASTGTTSFAEFCASGNCLIPATTLGTSATGLSANFQIAAGTKIGSISFLDQGLTGTGSEFYAPTSDTNSFLCVTGTVATATSCQADFTFEPQYAGERYGAVEIQDATGNILSTGYMGGVGLGAQLAFVPGTQSKVSGLNSARAVAADGLGNVYAVDFSTAAVFKVTAAGVKTTVPCCSGLTPSSLYGPVSVAVDGAGNVYISDITNSSSSNETSRLVKVPWNGSSYGSPVQVTIAGYGLGGSVDANGNIYSLNSNVLHSGMPVSVLKLSPAGVLTTIPCCSGLTPATINSSTNVKADAAGNLYIADATNRRVVKIPWNGSSYGSAVTVGSGFTTPFNVSIDVNNNVYVLDYTAGNVTVVPWNGSGYGTQYVVMTGLTQPYDLTVDSTGDVIVANSGAGYVIKQSDGTAPTLTWATPTAVGTRDAVDGSQTVTVQNIGNAALTLPTPSMGNNPSISAGFAFNNSTTCPTLSGVSAAGTLAQGSTCTYVVDFTPTAVGTNSGSVTITDNALGATATTQVIRLSGTGTAPIATLSTATLDFSSQVNGTTSTAQSVTVQNTGTVPLIFSAVSVTGTNAGDFTVVSGTNMCSSTTTLAVNASCTLSIAFAPTALGTRSATLNFADNAPNTPQTVSLIGTGVTAGTQMDWGTLPATPISVNGNAGSAVTVKEENSSKAVVTTATDTVTLTVTGPNNYSKTYTQTAVAGIATFNLSAAALPLAGTYTYTAAITGLTSITATETVNLLTPTLTWVPVPPTGGIKAGSVTGTGTNTVATIWTPAALGTLLNASTAAPDTSTCTYAATPTVGAVTAASVLPAGTYTLAVTCTATGTSVGVYAPISSTITLQVNGETITLTPSATLVQLNGSVTLQATVTGNAGNPTPTGTVTFFDGTTQIGSGTLVNGAYSFAWSTSVVYGITIFPATGTNALTVKYSGDSNYPAGTSAVVNETLASFTISCTSPTALTSYGNTGVINCTETPIGSTIFPGAITINATEDVQLTNVNGAFGSATAAPSTIAAGLGATNFTISVSTLKPPGASGNSTPVNPLLPYFGLLIPFLPLLYKLRKKMPPTAFRYLIQTPLVFMAVWIGVIVLTGAYDDCGDKMGQCNSNPVPCGPGNSTHIVMDVSGYSGGLNTETNSGTTITIG